MKRIVKFLCLMLLMIIGSVGQGWGASYNSKAGVVSGKQCYGVASVTYYNVAPIIGTMSKKTTQSTTLCSTNVSTQVGGSTGWTVASIRHLFTATPQPGYYCNGWFSAASDGDAVSDGLCGHYSENRSVTYYASFEAIELKGDASNTINLTAEGTYTTELVFTTNVDNMFTFSNTTYGAIRTTDFDVTLVPGGDAGWSIKSTSVRNGGELVVTMQYVVSETTTQGAHTANIEVRAKRIDNDELFDESVAIGTATANVDLTPVFTIPTEHLFGYFKYDADAAVMNADLAISNKSNCKSWEITAVESPFASSFDNLSSPSKVNISYDPKVLGSFEKTFKVTAYNGQTTPRSSTVTISLRGGAEEGVLNEVDVLGADGNTLTNGDGATWTEGLALAQANPGSTIVVYKWGDAGAMGEIVLPSTQTITENITLDLNGRTLSGAVSPLFNVNASGKEFTINDSKVNGKISNSLEVAASYVYGVQVTAGKLNLAGGIIQAANTGTGTESRVAGVLVKTGADFAMTGGEIRIANAPSYAYGVYEEVNATINVSGGQINVGAATHARALLIYGKATVSKDVRLVAATTGADAATIYVNDASANVLVDGGYITAQAGGATAYPMFVKQATAIVNITGGKFKTNATSDFGAINTTATVGKTQISGGFYNNTTNVAKYMVAGNMIYTVPAEYLAAQEGYTYGVGNEKTGQVVCKIIAGGVTTYYPTLEAALDYANQHPSTALVIEMTENYTLPAGYYTLPEKATLLIPYKANQGAAIGKNPKRQSNAYTAPSLYRKLTFASGVNLDVFGTIEASCEMAIKGQIDGNNGAPSGPFGQLLMEGGSHITLEDGSLLTAWGFVTGNGAIDAKRGAIVYEGFQMKDYPGGTCTTKMLSSRKAFPVTQYYIQNVEVATTYRPGSRLYTATGAYVSSSTRSANNVAIIGNSESLFLMDDADMSEATWVRKSYDATTDQQVYEINSSASLGNLTIKIGSTTLASKNFDLPITNNMLIKVLTGTMGITQNTIVLPGAEIEVIKEATLRINSNCSLFLIDQAEWANKHGVANGVFAHKVDYTPSWKTCPRNTGVNPPSAKVNLHGTFDMSGLVYTSAGGANICSTNEYAGTIKLNTNAPTTTKATYTKYSTSPDYETYTCNPASLRNSENQVPATASIADAKSGSSYCFIDDQWRCLETKVPFVIDKTDQYNWVYYAKPADYVALQGGSTAAVPIPDANHLYHSADGERLLILMPDNFWWEVKQTEEDDAVYYCEKNDTYYTYDVEYRQWVVKTVKVTFANFDGEVITYKNKAGQTVNAIFEIPFGGAPEYLIGYPTRSATDEYTYSFIGWNPQFSTETKLFENTTYIAQYEQHEIRYTVTFLDENRNIIEKQYLKLNEMPVCGQQPFKEGFYLYWKNVANDYPIAAVAGDVTYIAYYEEMPKTTFTIIYQNYNGSVLQTIMDVEEGVTPAYTEAAPNKPSTLEWDYVFAGWTPSVEPATADMAYMAKFDETARKYTVIFEDANHVEIERHQLGYGEVPVCEKVPTQASTAEFYYVAKWNKDIAAVTGDITYTHAGFTAYKNTLRLTVSADANGSVVVKKDATQQELSAIYDYGTVLTVTATPNSHYQFKQWSDGNKDNPRTLVLTETKNVQAQFELEKVTITWKVDEQVIATTQVDYGTVPSYTGATPTKPSVCGAYFTFAGWDRTFAAATSAQTYVAQFNEITNPSLIAYQVVFNGNGATAGSMANQGFDAGVSQKLSANQFINARIVTLNYNGNGQAAATLLSSKDFTGWSDGVNSYNDEQVVSDLAPDCDHPVITLNAQWSGEYSNVVLPTPTKVVVGHSFDGWYDAKVDGNKIGVAGDVYAPSADITLYAHWEAETFTITYKGLGGKLVSTEDLAYGSMPTMPADATMEEAGYIFRGWTPASVMVVANATYTAVYEDKTKHTVTFNMKGHGSQVEPLSVNEELSVSEPEEPEETGYTFLGWYKDDAYTMLWNFATDKMGTQNIDLYAKWEANQYEISFNLNYNPLESPTPSSMVVTYDAAIGELPSPTRTTHNFVGWYDDFDALYWQGKIYKEDDDVKLKAIWTIKQYEILFYGYQTTGQYGMLANPTVNHGSKPSYIGTYPTRPEDEKYTYQFAGWMAEGDDTHTIYASDELPVVVAPVSYIAQWDKTLKPGYTLVTGENGLETDWIVDGNVTAESLIITTDGSVEINSGKTLTLTDLIVKANAEESGQLNVDGNLIVDGNCYFDLELGMKTANTPARTWFSVAVPWEVDAATGIIADGKQLTLIRDIDVLRYNGATRAQNGANKSAWEYVQAGETMNPGTLYFIAFATQYNTIRFVKKSDAEIIFSSDMNVEANASMTGNGMDGGWNAIANPALYHATMDVDEATIAQVLVDGSIDNGARYDIFNLATDKLVVGKPVFVQVGAGTDGTVEINKVVSAGVAARRVAAKTDFYDVRIVEEGAEKYSDRVFVKVDEDAMAEYTIGADLVKMGTTNKVAQMWVPEYNAKLCVHTALLVNNVATMPLAIYAPKDGDYTLTLGNEANRDIYLTYNGAVVANLSLGEYTLSLTKGTATGYGLRIGAVQAPGNATDLDEAVVDAQGEVQKVLINGKLYIITEGHVYDAVGRMVK